MSDLNRAIADDDEADHYFIDEGRGGRVYVRTRDREIAVAAFLRFTSSMSHRDVYLVYVDQLRERHELAVVYQNTRY